MMTAKQIVRARARFKRGRVFENPKALRDDLRRYGVVKSLRLKGVVVVMTDGRDPHDADTWCWPISMRLKVSSERAV